MEVRPDVLCAEPSYKVSLEAVPSDPYYSSQQWGLQKINLPSAWNYITGSSTFCVGILDAGIDKSHSDLGSNVDLSYSRDCTNDPITTVSSVTDPNGHGTLAAGVIGAIDSNNQGISGICWNAKLVSLKVLGGSEILYTQSILRAIQYAASTLTDGISGNNIRILNISLGDYYPDTTWDTVLCAINNYPGLIVCSAGNDDSNNDENSHYPSQLTMWADNVISVGASTESDEIVTDTNYGATSVDIFAPGEDILSCFPKTLCSSTNCTVNGHFAYGYHKFSGTSLAAPHVTGVAALMLAENPNLTPAEIKATIIETAKYKAAFDGKCVSNGRLDAYEAIKAVHIHRYNYTTTASTHTGTCRCGYTMGTQNHVLITDAYGTQVCKVCGYSRIGQID